MLRLLQLRGADGKTRVAACGDEGAAHVVEGVANTRELAMKAIAAGIGLAEQVERCGRGAAVDLDAALAEGRVGLFLLQACLRFTVTGAALYLAGRWQAAALPAAALGIMAGRFVVLRPYRKSVP